MLVLLSAALALGAAQSASVDPPITKPSWARTPTADQVSYFYPQAAIRAHVQVGMGTIACDVDAKARMENCSISREDPPELGFGEAALKVAKYFKMEPKDSAGRPVAGGKVIIPIVFRPSR
ncbi:TonB family protein [Caulobacter sp. LARHSG274]